jgi:hypothetical protein
MESRQNKRFIVGLEAELLFGDTHIACSIENLSEVGIYIITSYSKTVSEFPPDTGIKLIFQFPNGERQCLDCKVKWHYKTPPHGVTNSVGMEIIDPPPSYLESLKTLI